MKMMRKWFFYHSGTLATDSRRNCHYFPPMRHKPAFCAVSGFIRFYQVC